MKRQSHNHPPHRPECSEHPVGACLVVIDPEDREQVERLVVAYCSQPGWHTGSEATEATPITTEPAQSALALN